MLFTFDKRFRSSEITTPRRKLAFQKFHETLETNLLDAKQVVVLQGKKNYVAESPSIIREYFRRVSCEPESVIFTDMGNAFFENGESVIERVSSHRTYQYPPAVHQYISPNDHFHHGAVKAKWRKIQAQKGWGQDDAVQSELCLLRLLTHQTPNVIRGYLKKNMFLDKPCPTRSSCHKVIEDMTPKKKKKMLFFRNAVWSMMIS